jgi:WD40 repeat protein
MSILTRWFTLGILGLVGLILTACAAPPTFTPSPIAPSATFTALVQANQPSRLTVTFEAIEGDTFSKPTNTPTATPTSTPTLFPTPLFTPAGITPVARHPLALTARNVVQMQRLYRWGSGVALAVAFSPDGRYLAVASDLGIFLYEAQTFEIVRLIETGYFAGHLAFSPDGTRLAIGGAQRVSVWDLDTGMLVAEMKEPIPGWLMSLVYGTNQRVAAIGTDCASCGDSYQVMKIWDATTGQVLTQVSNIYPRSENLSIGRDGRQLLFWNGDALEIRDLVSDTVVAVYGHYLPNAIMGEGLAKVFAYRVDEPDHYFRLESNGQLAPVLETESCRGLQRTVTYGLCLKGKTVVIFDLSSGAIIQRVETQDFIVAASLSADGQKLAVIQHGAVAVWDTTHHTEIEPFTFERLTCFALLNPTTDGKSEYLIATGNPRGQIKIQNLLTGEVVRVLQADENSIESLVASPDNRLLAALSKDGIARLWDVSQGALIGQYKPIPESTGPARFSPDGLRLALLANDEERILELDLQTAQTQRVGKNSDGYYYGITQLYAPFFYNANGQLISWDFNDERFRLVDEHHAETFTSFPYKIESDFDFVETAALSADQRYVAAGTAGGQIYVWDLTTNEQSPRVLSGHTPQFGEGWIGGLYSVFFSPQTDILVSFGRDGEMRLWDVTTGKTQRLIDNCCLANFTPDGRFLVTVSGGVIRVWGLPSLE